MKKIAFLTSENYEAALARTAGKFINEYDVLMKAFQERDYLLEKVQWRNKKIDWSAYERVIPKAVWDYFEFPDAFRTFLDQAKEQKAKWTNSVENVRWNMDKSYLSDFEKANLPIVPFELVKRGETIDEKNFKKYSGEIVVKPSISGGSRRTVRTQSSEWTKHQNLFQETLVDSDLMIQPFMPEVQKGEYSFFFFGDAFSHAVLKVPVNDDYRAHAFFGAENKPYSPSNKELDEISKFLSVIPEAYSYARVDVIKSKDKFLMIELEIIEPYLYLECANDLQQATQQFVGAILRTKT